MNFKDRRPGSKWQKAVALALLLFLTPACIVNPAQIYIPLAYAFTGLCIALLVSPTPTAAVVGLVVGGLIGAAVYNNSLKRQLWERHRPEPAPEK
jgi:membrane-associated phospholipid phosphatase